MNSTFDIKNSFNATSTNYNILQVLNSSVTVENSYLVSGVSVKNGNINGLFNNITLNELSSKEIVINNLFYKEFIDLVNLETMEDAIWVYEDGGLPILYIDDSNSSVANIFISKYHLIHS